MIYVNDVKLIESDEADPNTVHQQIVNRFEIKNLDMKMIYNCQ